MSQLDICSTRTAAATSKATTTVPATATPAGRRVPRVLVPMAWILVLVVACDRGSTDKSSTLTNSGQGHQDSDVASLEDALRSVLDKEGPAGASSWVQKGPVDDGLRIARGHEAEAITATRRLLSQTAPGPSQSSPRLRRNAVKLLAQLMFRSKPEPSAEEVYNALNRGEKVDTLAPLKDAMRACFNDSDTEVAVLAAVEVLKVARQDELARLRLDLMHLLPALQERRKEWPDVQAALATLGGGADALVWLREVDATTGPLPPNIGALLNALDADLSAKAAPHLRRLFGRAEAITARRDPRPMTLAGEVKTWDVDTLEAARILRLALRADPAQAASLTELLHATPREAMMRALLDEAGKEGEPAAELASAAAADSSLPASVREHAAALARRLASPS